MKISFGTRLNSSTGINEKNGYGYATNCMLNSLDTLGYHVQDNDSSADVEIWFDQPHHWNFSKGVYKIGYHPWESTLLQEGWADIMNQCDEIWTPSPLIAEWYVKHAGVKVPVYVYEHGIEHSWALKNREVEDTLKFLHVGAEASRKGGWDTVQAFRAAFGKSQDVELTLKMISPKWNGINYLARIHYMDEKLSFNELQNLFYDNHVYVYPSWGEGFGFTPIQAMATGMPTISVPGWAPYRDFMDERLNISHTMADSPWPRIHPGKMMKPNMDEVVDKMRWVKDNYESAKSYAMEQSPLIHSKYDWDEITKKMFSGLETRITLKNI